MTAKMRMLDVKSSFALPTDRIWLNCAHQGPIPRVAADSLREAVELKLAPHRIADELFAEVPGRLKRAIGSIINAPADEIILGNSTSYGLHVLANGIRWRHGDEVLVLSGEFPATTLPWSVATHRGVKVRTMSARAEELDTDRLAKELRQDTRALCVSWVNSFTGYTLDIHSLGALCRERGVLFIVNASQAIGHRSFDASADPVDAVSCCGFKWLCGPYGTGFCWIRPELRATLVSTQRYWLGILAGSRLDLGSEDDFANRRASVESDFDVFCAASFFNTLPWIASLELMLRSGLANIAGHDAALAGRFRERLDMRHYRLLSPPSGPAASPILTISHRDEARNGAIHAQLTNEGIDCAIRANRIRISPHFYNSVADVDRVVNSLHALS